MSDPRAVEPVKALAARERKIAGDRPLFGILCLVAAGFVFSFFNAIVKHLSAEGMPVMEVAWGRYVFHLVFAILYAGVAARFEPAVTAPQVSTPSRWTQPWRDMLRARKPGLQFLRSLLMLATTLLFFLAVSYVDLASATAVAFVEPLVITSSGPVSAWCIWRSCCRCSPLRPGPATMC